MKQILLFLVLSFSSFLYSQRSIDSVAIKQVDSLLLISGKLSDERQFDQAHEVNSQAEKIAFEKFGNESSSYAKCCFKSGVIYKTSGKYSEAVTWFIRSKEIREKTIGKMNVDYASSVDLLGNAYLNIDEFEKAEIYILEAQQIYGKLLGKDCSEYIWTIQSLGNLYYYMGDYNKAESFYIKSMEASSKVLGKNTRLYSSVLINLANLYADLNNFEKAELLYIESKEITAKLYGINHVEYVRILNNLSTIYSSMSKYEKAELLLTEAKSIQEKNNRKDDLVYGDILINFSNLYFTLGSFKKSELYLLEAKEIKEKLLGKDHPAYGDIIYNLSILYKEIGDFEKAETFSQEAKEITASVLGRDHPEYAWNLNGLAIIYSEFGYYEKAEPMFIEASELIAKTLGKESEKYAVTLENLSIMYLAKAQYKEAAQFILEAKGVIDKILGKENPEYTKVLKILATVYEYLGEFDKANNILKEYLSLSQTKLTESVSFLSEQELAWYTKTMIDLESNQGSFLMSRINQPQKIGILPELMINYSLFHKGFLMNAACRINKLSAFSSETVELNNQLKSYRRRLASEFSKPLKDRNSVNELEEKANAAEKELAHLISGFSEVKRQVNWTEVKKMLKKNQAAIEFINFRVTFPKITDSLMYAAVIIKPDLNQPEFIPLFEEKQLSELLTDHHNLSNSELLTQIYSRGATPLQTINTLDGLYNLCWSPLNELLKDVKKIYYSPSGLLNRINFDAVPMGNGATLSDSFILVRLGSLRSIVIPDLYSVNENNDAVLYGGIQYELDTTHSIVDTSFDIVNTTSQDLSFVYSDRSAPQRGGNWNYLPGTEIEVKEIESIFRKSKYPTQVFRGNSATEETFKNLGKSQKSPRILHVATHGFFFPDVKDTLQASNISVEQSTFKISDHPMIRSGLLLAGANYTWQYGKPFQAKMEDGILTAYEISQMNLSNTELVVLSACETGLGDVQGNEGVYGLQRAFKIAGAKYLIMSLWQVPDKQTSDLMKSFYQKWLAEKMSLTEAFRSAQKEMRERFVDPYAWAGFVLVE